jgi:NADPH-dependent glutamate synthase beta subunit-like oxidoreductase
MVHRVDIGMSACAALLGAYNQTSRPNVFSAGDMRQGQSLVVWAIREGRLCAQAIDRFRWERRTCRGKCGPINAAFTR